MFTEILFLHFSSVLFIIAVLILYLKLNNKFLLIMLLSMVVSQIVYWLPILIDFPEWRPSSSENGIDPSNLLYDVLQYSQLSCEVITAIAFFLFVLGFKKETKASKKAKSTAK